MDSFERMAESKEECYCYTPVHLKEECLFRRQTTRQMEDKDKKNPYRGERGEFMKRYQKSFVPYDWSGTNPHCVGCYLPVHEKEDCMFKNFVLSWHKTKSSK